MPKPLRLSLLIVAMVLGVTACTQGSATPAPGATASPFPQAARPTATPAAYETGQLSATLPPGTATAAANAQGPGCTVSASLIPTPGPTEAALYPAVSASDWIEGPVTAGVTFLEYSDFQ